QLGLAIILSADPSTSPFTSGTTSFFVGSIRHADELSITVTPASANFGANSVDVVPPAENKATSGFSAIASEGVTTLYLFPLKSISLPLLRSEATRSEEHTSELQSRENLVCRLLLEKKNNQTDTRHG